MASRTRRGGGGPYRRRQAQDLDLDALRNRVLGPASSRVEGLVSRGSVNADKRYRCPWCEGWIEPGTAHTLALPAGDPESRRHYHTGCWTRQAVLIRGGRQFPA